MHLGCPPSGGSRSAASLDSRAAITRLVGEGWNPIVRLRPWIGKPRLQGSGTLREDRPYVPLSNSDGPRQGHGGELTLDRHDLVSQWESVGPTPLAPTIRVGGHRRGLPHARIPASPNVPQDGLPCPVEGDPEPPDLNVPAPGIGPFVTRLSRVTPPRQFLQPGFGRRPGLGRVRHDAEAGSAGSSSRPWARAESPTRGWWHRLVPLWWKRTGALLASLAGVPDSPDPKRGLSISALQGRQGRLRPRGPQIRRPGPSCPTICRG